MTDCCGKLAKGKRAASKSARPALQRGCHARVIQTIQPFPRKGPLASRINTPLPLMTAQIGVKGDRTLSYVVRTVKLDRDNNQFEQHGSAPNFQGGVLTLCTCKHQMRASQFFAKIQLPAWIAGFTSRTADGRHWLVYLAKIKSIHESHWDLWRTLSPRTRTAKSACHHFLGDVFEPKAEHLKGNARFDPKEYYTPRHHVHRREPGDKGWHNDIRYRLANKYGHPPLLVADPKLTYLWDQPVICFDRCHCRNYLKWSSLSDLLSKLRGAS